MTDSDFSVNDPENGELAKPMEDSADIDALSHQQPDEVDDAVVAEDVQDAENPRIENQLGVSDAKAGVDFDVTESANDDSPSLDDRSLESSTALSSVNPVNSPVDPVGMFPADVSHSESKGESSVEMERRPHSELQPSPPESASPHDIEQTTDHRPIDEWTFAIDSSMSSDPAAETPPTFGPGAIVRTMTQSSTSTPGDISRAEIGSRFSEPAESVSLPAAQPAGDFVPLSQSKLNVEPATSLVDANDDAISALLRHNWDSGIPLPEDQSPDTAASFRMPPLLLEVSRTDFQSRIEKIEEAAAAHLNRIIGERIEAAMDERDFMRAAEMRALLR